ncbi:MAG: menaquinone-dependent protoporphyrinogen IX dehydrogenase [Gammaproteobacteria bacterium]
MAKILIVYSTTDGHTGEICRRLRQYIEAREHAVTLLPIDEAAAVDLDAFDKIVVGASIRYGKHHPKVYRFIETHLKQLDAKPNAFFSVNVVARKPEKNRPDTNPYLRKFLKQIAWKPKNLDVFAGKLDYPRYGFWDRNIIRFIMWMTQGPTDPKATIEFTDWDRVDAFARTVCDM